MSSSKRNRLEPKNLQGHERNYDERRKTSTYVVAIGFGVGLLLDENIMLTLLRFCHRRSAAQQRLQGSMTKNASNFLGRSATTGRRSKHAARQKSGDSDEDPLPSYM